ncbi:MAG: D-sedoheptulose 7-phosphate isomerase [Bacteroidales bacterium]|nr:D-sedoheptulose 7-phosphate isomerase [Bacteroidales bacterium]MBO7180284.1 D-sedoheptulose 7-phosphate isomerase [Bacteroidales bacterium]
MRIANIIKSSIDVKERILNDANLLLKINETAELIVKTYKQGGRVFFCGNGGSAADAQHLAAELSGRFYFDRPPLAAEALHVNTSYITAVANDYAYDVIFSREVDAFCKEGDVLVGISTSGNSANVLKAFETAKGKGVLTIAMTGESGGKMASISDILINIPSNDTPRIQESHITIGHIICQIVEEELFQSFKTK